MTTTDKQLPWWLRNFDLLFHFAVVSFSYICLLAGRWELGLVAFVAYLAGAASLGIWIAFGEHSGDRA